MNEKDYLHADPDAGPGADMPDDARGEVPDDG